MKVNDLLLQLFSVAIILFLYVYKNPTTTLFDLVLFISIIIVVLLLLSLTWILDKTNKIEENTKSINILQQKLNLRKGMEEANKRISKLEGWKEAVENLFERKKAQVDPRVIVAIFLVILIIIYLTSKGA